MIEPKKVTLGNYRIHGRFKIIPAAICCDDRVRIVEQLQASGEKLLDLIDVATELITRFCCGFTQETARKELEDETITLVDLAEIVKAAVSGEWAGKTEPREDSLELSIYPVGLGKRSKRIFEIVSKWQEASTNPPEEEVVELISLAAKIDKATVEPYVKRGYASIDSMREIIDALTEGLEEDSKKN